MNNFSQQINQISISPSPSAEKRSPLPQEGYPDNLKISSGVGFAIDSGKAEINESDDKLSNAYPKVQNTKGNKRNHVSSLITNGHTKVSFIIIHNLKCDTCAFLIIFIIF
jgi:hypothetical protein